MVGVGGWWWWGAARQIGTNVWELLKFLKVEYKRVVRKKKTHRGAKVVSHFVRERDVGDFGRNVGGVILHGDNASVQRLLLPVRVQLAFFTDTAGAP